MGSNVIKGSRRTRPVADPAPAAPEAPPAAEGEPTRTSEAVALPLTVEPVGSQGEAVAPGHGTGRTRTLVAQPHGGALAQPWPEGVSGNPGGRHRTKPLEAALRDLVDADPQSIASGLVAAARGGDVNAARVVLETLYGKPTQRIELDVAAKGYSVRADPDDR